MTHDEIITIVEAHRDGKALQYKSLTHEWIDESDIHFLLMRMAESYPVRIKLGPVTLYANIYMCGGKVSRGYMHETAKKAKRGAGKSAARIAVPVVIPPEGGE